MSHHAVSEDVLDRIQRVVGVQGCIRDAAELAPYLVDQRGRYRGVTPMVVRPASVAEVAAVISICAGARIGIVPQGGNTGLVGGSVPDERGGQIVLCLSRMNRIRDLDAGNFTATVEAGCVLANLQAAAEQAELLFPLSLGAEGSCQIGGNLASNAGGTTVMRYGNARDLVLGLEVVLPNGEIWDGLRRLRKDNTGYDIKQLFLGSEGTLGVITAAVVKLFPRPRQMQTALVAVDDPGAATRLLARTRGACGESVTTFEYLNRNSLALVLGHIPATRNPFAQEHEHLVLVSLTSARPGDDLRAALEEVMEVAFGEGEVLDAVIAESGLQAEELHRLRESIPEAQRHAGAGIKHDISVPVSRVPQLLEQACALVERAFPEAIIVAFGHLGDGNIHFNLNQPEGMARDRFLARESAMNELIHGLAVELGGSFSAEHGIGRLKTKELQRFKSPVELEVMRAVKRALDPYGILNPGKVIAA